MTQALAGRLVGKERGDALTELTIHTIRSVFKGVLGVAFIQAALAAASLGLGYDQLATIADTAVKAAMRQVPLTMIDACTIAFSAATEAFNDPYTVIDSAPTPPR